MIRHRNGSSYAHQVFGGSVIVNCDKRATIRIKCTFSVSHLTSLQGFVFTVFVHHRLQVCVVKHCSLYVTGHMFVHIRLQKIKGHLEHMRTLL